MQSARRLRTCRCRPRLQTVAKARHVGRRLDVHARDRRAVERALLRGLEPRGAERASALRVGFADIEMWPAPIVPNEERAPVLEPPVEVHDRAALAILAGLDAIARLQDEAAVCAHGSSLHHRCRLSVRRTARSRYVAKYETVTAAMD